MGLGRQPLRRTQFVRILPRCWLDTPRPRIRVLHQTRLVHHAPDLTAYPDSDGVPSSEAEDLATSLSAGLGRCASGCVLVTTAQPCALRIESPPVPGTDSRCRM